MSSTNDNNGETGASAESEPVASRGGVKRRQYKKDTIYLYDLYTLTYDNNEQLESIETFNTLENENVRKFRIGIRLCRQIVTEPSQAKSSHHLLPISTPTRTCFVCGNKVPKGSVG